MHSEPLMIVPLHNLRQPTGELANDCHSVVRFDGLLGLELDCHDLKSIINVGGLVRRVNQNF